VDQQADQRLSHATGVDALTRHRFLPTRAGVIELVVLFALLMVVDRLIMQPGDFAKLQPHPYWLPVILLSLQYGTADGVLAAAVAILVSLALGWPSQGIAEDYYRYIVRVWAVPIGWILIAIVIGEVRARQRSSMVELKRELTESRDQAETITNHCYRLEDKIQRIEREFATVEATSLDSLAASLLDLHRGDVQHWRESMARVHRGLVGTGTLAVMLRCERSYLSIARVTMPGEPAAHLPQPMSSALGQVLERSVSARQALSAQRPQDAAILDGLAAMVIPLWIQAPDARGADGRSAEPRSADSRSADYKGRIAGVLLVDSLRPDRLTMDTENRLSLLAREISHALGERGWDDLLETADDQQRIDLVPVGQAEPETTGSDVGARRIGIFPRFGRA
jgi:hypothetical protein